MMEGPEDQPESAKDRLDRRAFPRLDVDCVVIVSPVSGSGEIPGRIVELSLGGCRVITERQTVPAMMTRVEVQFELRGIALRLAGVGMGSRSSACFAVRFLDLTARRREQLTELIGEIENG